MPKYSDFNLNNKGNSILEGDEPVRQSIKQILNTYKGERFFDPTFGSNLEDSLFRIMDHFDAAYFEQHIRTTIMSQEDRIKNVKASVIDKYDDNTRILELKIELKNGSDFIQELFFDN